eukprot:430385-Lingulodinium_polyedra.AAC.1
MAALEAWALGAERAAQPVPPPGLGRPPPGIPPPPTGGAWESLNPAAAPYVPLGSAPVRTQAAAK